MLFGVYCCAAGFTGESHAGRHNGSTIVGAAVRLVSVKRVVCGGSVGDVVFPGPSQITRIGNRGRGENSPGRGTGNPKVPIPRPDGARASTCGG